MQLTIPESLKQEHDELHAELATATKAGGRTGQAALAVAKLMHPHFEKEEEYALPPLGLLAALTRGDIVPDMRNVLPMTDALKDTLSSMLEEHRAIVAALETLVVASLEESHPEIAAFARRLMHHALMEEQVMYPAALLVGEYIRLRLASPAR